MIMSFIFFSLAKMGSSSQVMVSGASSPSKMSGNGATQGPSLSSLKTSSNGPSKLKIYSKYKTYFDYSFRSSHYSSFVSTHNVANPFALNCGSSGLSTSYSSFIKAVMNNLCVSEGFNATPCTGCQNHLYFTSELYSSTASTNFTSFLLILKNNLLEYRNQTVALASGGFSPVGSSGMSFPNNLNGGATVVYMMEAVVPMEYFPGSEQDTLVEEIKTLLSQIRSTIISGIPGVPPVNARMFLYFLLPKSVQGTTVILNKFNEIIGAATQGRTYFATSVNQEYPDTVNPLSQELEINSFLIQSAAHTKMHWNTN